MQESRIYLKNTVFWDGVLYNVVGMYSRVSFCNGLFYNDSLL